MGAMKTGVGSARADLANGAMICVLSVVNALGNIINQNGSILAGNRDEEGGFKSFAIRQNLSHKAGIQLYRLLARTSNCKLKRTTGA